mmetsp:Transcript_89754/g.279280  ORF Transcript_89754/g.279280 Transcript_89754/m.279280 type:complete len:281 (+) Transcript_89754:129-971(+)
MAPVYTYENPAPNPAPTKESGPALLVGVPWIDANWMYISCVICPISFLIIWFAFKGSFKDKLKNPYVIGWLSTSFYFMHQVEEHALDFRGWHYAFVPGFNYEVGPVLFPICDILGHNHCPITPRLGTYINVVAIWIGFSLTMVIAHYKGGKYAYAGIVNWGMSFVNGIAGHLVPWILMGYNSGAVQSLLFLVPFGLWAFTRDGPKFAVACIANGMIFHMAAFGMGVNLMLKFSLPPEFDAVLCFVFSCIVPLAIAGKMAPETSNWYLTEQCPKGEPLLGV